MDHDGGPKLLLYDLNFTGTRRIALYCVDWLNTGTVLEKIEVFDSSKPSNPLIDTRDLKLPANGVHLVWRLADPKTIRVTKPDATPGNKAMVSAIFSDIIP